MIKKVCLIVVLFIINTIFAFAAADEILLEEQDISDYNRKEILITVKDSNEEPVSNKSLSLTTDFGKLDKITVKTNTSGQASFIIKSEDKGSGEVTVSADGISQSINISFTFPTLKNTISILYDSNSEIDKFSLNGDAAYINIEHFGKALQITNHTTENDSYGSIFTNNPIKLNSDFSFSTYFSYAILHSKVLTEGNMGKEFGEGFTFSLQAEGPQVLGSDNASKGMLGVNPSISIEIDTNNENDLIEYNKAHLSVFKNGEEGIPLASKEIDLFKTELSGMWIDYDGKNDQMIIRHNYGDNRPDEIFLTIDNIDIEDIFTKDGERLNNIYPGFTGVTRPIESWDESMISENFQIFEWYFSNSSDGIFNKKYNYTEVTDINISVSDLLEKQGKKLKFLVSNIQPLKDILIKVFSENADFDLNKVITNEEGKASIEAYPTVGYTTDAAIEVVVDGALIKDKVILLDDFQGDVNLDKSWLTFDKFKGSNNNVESIETDLELLFTGKYGSNITWTSSNEGIISSIGEVTKPSYEIGPSEVVLTATLNKGDVTDSKVFNLIVQPKMTDTSQAIEADFNWLLIQDTLRLNKDSNSIKTDLGLPTIAPNGSEITWESSDSSIIDSKGKVNRNSINEDTSVLLTANFSLENLEKQKEFSYLVVKRDLGVNPVEIIESVPQNNEVDVNYKTNEIILEANQDLKRSLNFKENIKVGYEKIVKDSDNRYSTEFKSIEFNTEAKDDKLFIQLKDNLKSLTYYEVYLDEKVITGLDNEPLKDDFRLRFKTEKILQGELEMVESTPRDYDVNISPFLDEISLKYNTLDFLEYVDESTDISLIDLEKNEVDIGTNIKDDFLNIEINQDLNLGEKYTLIVPTGTIQDRYERPNEYSEITFKVKKEIQPPVIDSIKPSKTVVKNQDIFINFNEKVKIDKEYISLRDSEDKGIPINIYNTLDNKTLIINPEDDLIVDKNYNIFLSDKGIKDFSDNNIAESKKIDIQVKENVFNLELNNSYNNTISLEQDLIFDFESIEDLNFDKNLISLKSKDESLNFDLEISNKKIVISPKENLKANTTYTFEFDKNSLYTINKSNDLKMVFKVKTDEKLTIYNYDRLSLFPFRYYGVKDHKSTFKADAIKYRILRGNREIISSTWKDLDGNIIGSGTTLDYKFDETGYKAFTLIIKDNKGFEYSFIKNFVVKSREDVKLDFYPKTRREVYGDAKDQTIDFVFSKYQDFDYKVDVYLTDNSQSFKRDLDTIDFSTIEDEFPSKYIYKFDYSPIRANQISDYIINFEYEFFGEKIVKKVPLRIYQQKSAKIDFKFYDIDGEKIDSRDFNIKINNEDFGTVDNFPLDYKLGNHDILITSEKYKDISIKRDVLAFRYYPDHINTYWIRVELKDKFQPEINEIYVNQNDLKTNKEKLIFYNKDTTFNIEFNTKGYKPKCLKVKSTKSKYEEKISLNEDAKIAKFYTCGAWLEQGDEFLFQIVTENGFKSRWKKSKYTLAHLPRDLRAYFPGKGNTLSGNFFIPGKISDNIPILNDWPLIGGNNGFGIFTNFLDAKGKANPDGEAYLIGNDDLYVKSLGMLITGSAYSKEKYKYNFSNDSWYKDLKVVSISAKGAYTITREYEIPGIKKVPGLKKIIKGWIKLTLSSEGGTTYQQRYNEPEEWIIEFTPGVGLAIGAGTKVLNVEGYGNGTVQTQYHIPTEYIKAHPVLTLGIRATFLLWKGTIYEKSISDTWENGKTPVQIGKAKEDSFKLEMLSRKYKENKSVWIPNKNMFSRLVAATNFPLELISDNNPKREILKTNIYPDASVSLLNKDSNEWIFWIDDNPNRSDENRTQVKYATKTADIWSEPKWLTNGNTGDFNVVAEKSNDGLFVAYQDMNKVFDSDSTLEDYLENTEIVVNESPFDTNPNDSFVRLTDDSRYDYNIDLSFNNDNGLIIWQSLDGFIGEEDITYQLKSSTWENGSWSNADVLETFDKTLVDSKIIKSDGEYLTIFLLNDEENDIYSIMSRIYDGNSWSENQEVVTNKDFISNVQGYYIDGKYVLTWFDGDKIIYKNGLNSSEQDIEELKKVSPDYQLLKKEDERLALVYKKPNEKSKNELAVVFYDLEKDVWSNPVLFGTDPGFIRKFNAEFNNDELDIVYTHGEIVDKQKDGLTYNVPSDSISLRHLNYKLENDLQVDYEKGLSLDFNEFIAGSLGELSINILNSGSNPLKADVSFYYQKPGEKREKIDTVEIDEWIGANKKKVVTTSWIMPEIDDETIELSVEIETKDGFVEKTLNNNKIFKEIYCQDLLLNEVYAKNIGGGNYIIQGEVTNNGAGTLNNVNVYLNDLITDDVKKSKSIGTLNNGNRASYLFNVNSDSLQENEEGKYSISINTLSEDVKENNMSNNIANLELEKKKYKVVEMNISQNAENVNIDSSIDLSFNMPLNEINDEEKIKLVDKYLNEVPIDITLDKMDLKIDPVNEFEYEKNYELIILKDAFTSNKGQGLVDDFKLSFLTTSKDPKVISTIPINGFEISALDDQLIINFNVLIDKGQDFEQINLKDENENILNIKDIQINSKTLIINSESLSYDTSYKLTIPKMGIKNEDGVFLQKDYVLDFSTKEKVNRSSNDTNDKDLSEKLIDYKSENEILVEISNDLLSNNKYVYDNSLNLDLSEVDKEVKRSQVIINKNIFENVVNNNLSINILTKDLKLFIPASVLKSINLDDFSTLSFEFNIVNEINNDQVSPSIYEINIFKDQKPIKKFSDKILIEFPIDFSKINDLRKTVIKYFDDKSKSWKSIGGIISDNKIFTNINHLTKFGIFEQNKTFVDLDFEWSKDAIEVLSSRGLINGVDEKRFNPLGKIKRSEITALVVRSLYLENENYKEYFEDVEVDKWYFKEISLAKELGIIKGISKNKFKPNLNITRQDLATIIYRFIKFKKDENIKNIEVSFDYKDSKKISNYSKEAINYLYEENIMVGNGKIFRPLDYTTRQEAAIVIYRTLKNLGEIK